MDELRAAISATRRSPSRMWPARAGPGSPSTRSRSTRPPPTRPRTRTSTLRLWQVLKPRLAAERPRDRLRDAGAAARRRARPHGDARHPVDRQILCRLSGDFAQTLARLEDEIQEIAGENFSLGSPKQIGDILFGKMGLPGAKKTPSGQWATPATLLDELAQAGHELPEKILEWRQLAKLKSTYTDALQQHCSARPGRVHTSFSLAATTTGRLSSSDPNLQNIPIRTEDGPQDPHGLRRAEGHKIISADYSQIELRSSPTSPTSRNCSKPSRDGIDIHAATASAMFGVPLDGDDAGPAPAGQDHQFRHHLRHLGLRPRRPPRHPERGGRRSSSSSISSAFRASAPISTRPRSAAATMAT